MKIFKLSFLLILGISVLSSCAKKDTPAPAPTVTSSMSATLDGTSWTAASVSSGANAGTLAVVGTSSNSTEIEIAMPSTTTPGTYSPSLGGSYDILYNNVNYMSSGSIVITSNTGGVVSGTFSGTLTNASGSGPNITVTNGAFTAKYQ